VSTKLAVVFLQQISAVVHINHHLAGSEVLVQTLDQAVSITALT
jgi:hypothetical protein